MSLNFGKFVVFGGISL